MFKGLSNLAGLMANAGELKEKAAQMQERISAIRAEGSAGGGMVRVEVSGNQSVLSVNIEESLIQGNDREMLEDLIIAATNEALDAAKKLAASEMSDLAGGLNIPGLTDALASFGGPRS